METEFNTVFELYQNIVVQAAALYTRNQHTAEDIAQEVFLRYYIYAGCGEVENVKGWLLTTAKYSLQGTIQGNGLTGGVPPVRFSM